MAEKPKKIIELVKDEFSCSYEITPDVDTEELCQLNKQPVFYSVTWHAKSHQCKDLNIQPLKIASFLRSKNLHVLLHLSCDLLKKFYLEKVLAFLQENGICNLLLMLGEGYDPSLSDFQNTLELICYIRSIAGQYFCIGVTGFCDCNDGKMVQLKEKVAAGADFIITQAFFEAEAYINFYKRCRNIGIQVPIFPGIFIFENYEQLVNITKLCKIKVSDRLMHYVKENNGKEEIIGMKIIMNMIKLVFAENHSKNLHFFTLNKLQKSEKFIQQIKQDLCF